MRPHVFRGTKEQIVEQINRLVGDVHEAIVYVNEKENGEPVQRIDPNEDIFAEMDAYMVEVGDADDSREAIYSRMEGE